MIKRAVILAVILLAFTLVLYHVGRQKSVPPLRDLLAFPEDIAGFHVSKREEMSPKVIKVLGVTDYIMWTYCQTHLCIDLYVGYFRRQEEGAMIHSPKHCMPGGGWAPLVSQIIKLKTKAGVLPINRYLLQKGDEKILVYYWYQGRGRVVANEVKDRLYLLWDRLWRRRSDEALVRLIVPYSPKNEQELRRFARALYPLLKKYLPS